MYKSKLQTGFTLVELIITVAVLGILMSIGLPSLKSTMQSNKMTSLHNDLLSSLSFARNAAITKGSSVSICKSSSATSCSSSGSWKDGWIVIPDRDGNGVIDTNARILAVSNDLAQDITILSNRNRITYSSQGYANGYSNVFTFCDSRGDNAKKGMIISNNGRIRVAESEDSLLAGCPQ